MKEKILSLPLGELINSYPCLTDFFSTFNLQPNCLNRTLESYLSSLPEDTWEDLGLGEEQLLEKMLAYLYYLEQIKHSSPPSVHSITILGGIDKDGQPENIKLAMEAGEIICLVGPTGSGKSRLLADIEWMAQRDTPTQRQILLNGEPPSPTLRFFGERKLVAQLSQNMNFIMDLTVEEFLTVHAESRMVEKIPETVAIIIAKANNLAGERFRTNTPLTALSGGQSRALMIADTAYLSPSPVVLIDEIENAGIDRQKALELLVSKEKIVLMATHDPLLALLGHKRLILKNGGISRIIETTETERKNLSFLQKLDHRLLELRENLRSGLLIEKDLSTYFQEI